MTGKVWLWRDDFPDLGMDIVESLILKLYDDDLELRWKSAWIVGMMRDERASAPLLDILKQLSGTDTHTKFFHPGGSEPDFPFSLLIVWGLGRLKCKEAVEPLVDAFEFFSDPAELSMKTIIAWALGEIGDKRAFEHLKGALFIDEMNDPYYEGLAFDAREPDMSTVLEHLDSLTNPKYSPIKTALEKLGYPE